MLQEETQVPVFFTHETPDLLDIYEDIKSSSNSDAAESATEGNMTMSSNFVTLKQFEGGQWNSNH